MTSSPEKIKIISAAEIMKHFSVGLNAPVPPRSIGDLVLRAEYENCVDMRKVLRSIQQLVNEGLLADISQGPLVHPILDRSYLSVDSESVRAPDEYNCLAGGWPEIFKLYRNSVWRIDAEHENGDPDVGSGFLAGNLNTLLTAKHVLLDVAKFKFLDPRGIHVEPQYARFFRSGECDVAAVKFEQPIGKYGDRAFKLADHKIAEEVLFLGHPTVANFKENLVAERGNVIASDVEYHATKRFFGLISSRLRGGNSGGPVVNRFGQAVGLVSASAASRSPKSDSIEFGFGAFVPKVEIIKLLRGPENPQPDVLHVPFVRIGKGWWTLDKQQMDSVRSNQPW